MEDNILEVGYRKGEIDFGIRATIQDLTYEQMNKFRAMCMVAIGVAEDMWRRSRNDQTSNCVKVKMEFPKQKVDVTWEPPKP